MVVTAVVRRGPARALNVTAPAASSDLHVERNAIDVKHEQSCVDDVYCIEFCGQLYCSSRTRINFKFCFSKVALIN